MKDKDKSWSGEGCARILVYALWYFMIALFTGSFTDGSGWEQFLKGLFWPAALIAMVGEWLAAHPPR